jgi:hypothetical protein
MHVCFAAIDYHGLNGGGGIASYVETIGEALVARGHQVSIIAKGERLKIEERNGLKVVWLPFGNLHWYFYRLHFPSVFILPVRELEWSLSIRRALKLLQQSSHVDVVESGEIGISWLSRQSKDGAPLVVRLHGETYIFRKFMGAKMNEGERLTHAWELASLARAAAITAPSLFQAQEIGHEIRQPTQAIKVIPNPIHPFLIKATQLETAPFEAGNSITVLYTGRIEDRKGVAVLLQAVPLVLADCPDAHFVLAGARHNSIDDAELDSLLGGRGVRAQVELLGHINREQVAEYYRQASVFVMPSYYETFGISVIEAMAFGLPVVATSAGGLPEVVEDGVTGILVEPGDAPALAKALVELLRNPARRQQMGRAGRERVFANFTVDKVVNQTLEVYDSVIH